MPAARRKLVGWLVVGSVILLFLIAVFAINEEHPECGSPRATLSLAKLYDNKRLLRATDVLATRQLSDGLKGRYCMAVVVWADGSQREVRYGFEHRGRSSKSFMWIDYNN